MRLDTSADVSGTCQLAARIVVDSGLPTEQVSGEQRVQWGPAPTGSDIDVTVPVSWAFMLDTSYHSFQVQVSQQAASCSYATPLDVTNSQVITESYPLNKRGNETPSLG